MNDDELDKLFGVDEEDVGKETEGSAASDDNADTDEEKSTESSEGSSEESKEEEDEAAKEAAEREEKRRARQLAREKQEKEAEEYARKKEAIYEARAKAREKRRKERAEIRRLIKEKGFDYNHKQFFPNCPLSFKHILFILLGLSVLTLLLYIVISPNFRISRVEITGNYQMTDEQILALTGIDYGDHLFSIGKANESSIASDNPYINSIRISSSYPSTLRIEVSERRKIAYIRTPDGYVAIDDEGTVLEFSSEYNSDIHPVICGLNIDHAILGEKLDILEDIRYQKMIIVLGAVLAADLNSTKADDYSFFDNLQEVRIIPSGLIFLTVRLPEGSILQVKLADIDSISDDMHWLMYSIEENAFYNAPPGALDMTGDKYIYREYM